MKSLSIAVLSTTFGLAIFIPVQAENAAKLLGSADAKTGQRLHQEKSCAVCHTQGVSGGNAAFYQRPERKIHSIERLIAQVTICNSQLSTGLFPEEELDVVDYLNSEFYHFK